MSADEHRGRRRPFDDLYAGLEVDAVADLRSGAFALNDLEHRLYVEAFFDSLVRARSGARLLSVGGGIDLFALRAARRGARVTCVDLSPVAADKTRALAERFGLQDRLTYLTGDLLQLALPGPFETVLAHRSLHHMPLPAALDRIWRALLPGGALLADEPVCLTPEVRWLHRALPFHPNHPCTAEEHELTADDLRAIRARFARTRAWYFDLLTRNSLAYLMDRAGLGGLLPTLSRWDHRLLQALPPLRPLSSYVVICATR